MLALFFLQGLLWGGCGSVALNSADASEQESIPVPVAGDLPMPGAGETLTPGIFVDPHPREADRTATADTVVARPAPRPRVDSLAADPSTAEMPLDSLLTDSLSLDSLAADRLATVAPVNDTLPHDSFLDEPMSGTNTDSTVYDLRTGLVHVYREGEITYTDKQLQADYMTVDMNTRQVYANGIPDTAGVVSRPIFTDAGTEFRMDSLNYNLGSGIALIRKVWTQESDGFLRGELIKRMADNSINIAGGTYTTCDLDHPHFYIQMNRTKVLPGQKAIFQMAHLVVEDVPIPLWLPFGYFPLATEHASGFIMPTVGEEARRGFYLNNGGYYWAPNDYLDMTLLGGIYTLGSWEASLAANYLVRYRYGGGFNLNYSNFASGDKGSTDYREQRSFRIGWNHRMDPKARPGTTFSASVDFSTAGANRYSPQSTADLVTNQTSSSISYGKTFTGTPFSFTASLRHSQTNSTETYNFNLPDFSINMTRVFPFRRAADRRVGRERWYEKIGMTYAASFQNPVNNVPDSLVFKKEMFDRMNPTMTHTIPVSASFNVGGFLNLTTGFNYAENWSSSKQMRGWDAAAARPVTDTVRGFYRTYRYSANVGANTIVYGRYLPSSPRSRVEEFRHVITPSVSLSYTPDLTDPRHGFYMPYQTNAQGGWAMYSPYWNAPGGAAASLSFSLRNTLEAKLRRTEADSVQRKIKIIDAFDFNGSYNFLADSLNFSPISVTFRSTIVKGFAINLNGSLNLYQVDRNGRSINKFLLAEGKPFRLASLSTSFGYNFTLGDHQPVGGATNSATGGIANTLYDPSNPYDPLNPMNQGEQTEDETARTESLHAYRNLLSSQYYDFSVPLNMGFNYSFNYTNNGVRKTVLQTLGFNLSANLTPKWGVTFNSGYNFETGQLTTGTFTLSRDLHCAQMSFNWVPFGSYRSWNFHLGINSNILRDLKYDKSSSMYDNDVYDNYFDQF